MATGMINVDTSLSNRLVPGDGKLLAMAEHFDKFLVAWEMTHPSVWRDRLPKGTFTLFNGLSQKTNIFRGTLGPQAGLADWSLVAASTKPGAAEGNDYCQYNPQTYDWSYESMDFIGYRTSWRSPAFCVNDLKFVDYAKEQLGFIIRAGSQVTDMTKETFNREMWVKTAVDAGKGMILCEGGLAYIDDSTVRFSYNPLTEDTDGNTYITFAASLLPKISTLNFTYMDYIRQYMSDMCPDAAVGMDSGMPVFGMMLDLMDFERYALNDANLREDFRHALPQRLISGFNMGFRVYRGFMLIHDPRQMRFKVQTITAGSLAKCVRVLPRRATRQGTVGYIPETNPAYLQAELALGVVFINDVIQILVPPTVNNMGSGMVFGPAPDYNGAWTWLNIQDAETNPLREIGYFFARFEYYVKPLQYASEATVFIYRRCPHAIRSGCAVETSTDVGVGAVAMATVPSAADFDATLRTVTLELTKKLAAGVGDTVTVNTDDGDDVTMQILEDRDAPVYTFGWASGATNAPSAVTELNDPAIVTVTVA